MKRAVVAKIVDGDTIHATVDGEVEKIRVSGIDAPETDQEYGTEATDALRSLIPVGTTVKLQLQGSASGAPERGRYGRLLANIFLVSPSSEQEKDGLGAKSVSLMMLERGAAWHYTAFNNDAELARAEEQARKNKVGLWSGAGASPPVRPSDFRKLKKIERLNSTSSSSSDEEAVVERVRCIDLNDQQQLPPPRKRRTKPTPTAPIAQ